MMSSHPNSTVNNNEEKPYAVVDCIDGSLHVHEGLYYLLLKNVTKNDPFTDKEIRVSDTEMHCIHDTLHTSAFTDILIIDSRAKSFIMTCNSNDMYNIS